MNEILKPGIRLTIICAAAALVLALINTFTEPVIKQIKKENFEEALTTLVGKGGNIGKEQEIKDNNTVKFIIPIRENSKISKYIVKLIGKGFNGDLEILAAYFSSGELINAILLYNEESNSKAKMAEKAEYMEKFKGKGAKKPIPTRKSQLSLKEVDGISGATITFSGISNALAAGSDFIKQRGGK